MTDRLVRQLVPKTDEADQRKPFSAFSDQPNIVLLGAPGAGKTHLFTEAAAGIGQRITTRDFLNTPSFSQDKVLFIDALDEHRAGRGDRDAVNEVVKKLFAVRPKKIRISCRESDWLGETDLATFKPYFDQNGGHIVLGLEHLTEDEKRIVLSTQGVTDPDEFLEEARKRRLGGMLTNPQNLLMLAKSVEGGIWPRNLKELFEKATTILLSEHNLTRMRDGDGIYGPEELRGPAGAVLAARLIGDVDGVSLTENQLRDEYPSYRTVPYPDVGKVRAALARRAFVGNGEEAADYTHRTTAEYLGAEWLAKQIKDGLPIGRVRALIGIDGHPAPELRGLHAWLAVHCPTHANVLIDTDPYGVLTYGDAASLGPSHRKRLLAALALLSETDPWFSRDEQAKPELGALASEDLAPSFRSILHSKEAKFTLKRLVLYALADGAPLPSVQNEIIAVFANPAEPYGLRHLAFEALKASGPPGINKIKELYPRLKLRESDIRLRAEIIGDLYGMFSVADVIAILNDAIKCPDDLPGGILRSIYKAAAFDDIPTIIERINTVKDEPTDRQLARNWRHNAYDVNYTVGQLVLRYLQESKGAVSADTLWRLLAVRRSLGTSYGRSSSDSLQAELSKYPDLLRALFEKAMDQLSDAALNWSVLWNFREATLMAIDERKLTTWMAERVQSTKDTSAKQAFIYEMALNLAIKAEDHALFDELYAFGEARPDLVVARGRNAVSEIQEWQREDAARRIVLNAETAAGAAKTLQAFERDKEKIRDGTHLGWMAWLSEVYFDPFHDGDSVAGPQARLEQKIGADNSRIALEGFQAVLGRAVLPSVEDVGRANAKNSYFTWWYAPIAGMDERWTTQPDFTSLPDELLKKLVAMKLVMHTEERTGTGTGSKTKEHSWHTAIIKQRPELVAGVYEQLASMGIKNKNSIVHGLYELLNDQNFATIRQSAILTLLKKFPSAPTQQLTQLLKGALSIPDAHTALSKLAQNALKKKAKLGADQVELWLGLAYLLNPTQHDKTLQKQAKRPAIVWHLRALLSSSNGRNYSVLTVAQLDTIIQVVARHFPEVPHPTSSSGDENAWDGSEFLRNLVNQLSSLASEDASTTLRRLSQLPSLLTYRDFIKHALANQRARLREVEYRQPNWAQTVSALTNGTPANAADLQALVLDHCKDLNNEIGNRNNDIYKQFWNVDSHGRIVKPRSEEICRDTLLGMLQNRLWPLGIVVEPEGHMAADKRVDISVALAKRKTVFELKRDYHRDVWHAHETQLDRLYTRDPDASGFGLYGVIWFGTRRPKNMPARPGGERLPQSAGEMQKILDDMIPESKRSKLSVIVIDVSGPSGSKKSKRKAAKKRSKRTKTARSKAKKRR
jgi:hypothetical protein